MTIFISIMSFIAGFAYGVMFWIYYTYRIEKGGH